jgi:hypothetical protein
LVDCFFFTVFQCIHSFTIHGEKYCCNSRVACTVYGALYLFFSTLFSKSVEIAITVYGVT